MTRGFEMFDYIAHAIVMTIAAAFVAGALLAGLLFWLVPFLAHHLHWA